jgi:hypothetical protein
MGKPDELNKFTEVGDFHICTEDKHNSIRLWSRACKMVKSRKVTTSRIQRKGVKMTKYLKG